MTEVTQSQLYERVKDAIPVGRQGYVEAAIGLSKTEVRVNLTGLSYDTEVSVIGLHKAIHALSGASRRGELVPPLPDTLEGVIHDLADGPFANYNYHTPKPECDAAEIAVRTALDHSYSAGE